MDEFYKWAAGILVMIVSSLAVNFFSKKSAVKSFREDINPRIKNLEDFKSQQLVDNKDVVGKIDVLSQKITDHIVIEEKTQTELKSQLKDLHYSINENGKQISRLADIMEKSLKD